MRRLLVLAPAVLFLSGCRRAQTSLEPRSHQSHVIANLFWWMMGGAWIGLALVVFLLLLSRARANRRGFGRDTEGRTPAVGPAWYVAVGAGMAVPFVLLWPFFVIEDLFVSRTTEA